MAIAEPKNLGVLQTEIDTERMRRQKIWDKLKELGTPDCVDPKVISDLRIHRGQQAVFRDQTITGPLTVDNSGIAVGLLHTGSAYIGDLFEDGIIYHYPVTSRGRRDQNEIAAMKACNDFFLPVFVVVTPHHGSAKRNIRLGWVSDFDDIAGVLLITFDVYHPKEQVNDDSPFILRIKRMSGETTVKTRPLQASFRFGVFKRYGPRCAFCPITEPKLLEAAHLCPVEEGGSDDPRNGLVLCLTHHRAFDTGLVLISPTDLTVQAAGQYDLQALGVTVDSINGLAQIPHREAISWAWKSRKVGTKSEFPSVQ